MDFQTDFLGLDNVSTYYNAAPSSHRRRTSTMSTSSSSSTTSSPVMSKSSPLYSPPTPAPRNLHKYNHHRQSSDLSTEVDAGAVAAFGALRTQSRRSKSPRPSSSIEVEIERGSHSSTSSPIAIPPRTTAARTTMSARRRADLQAGVVGMRRAMDMAGFGAHMNS